jgi:hypothetical protein
VGCPRGRGDVDLRGGGGVRDVFLRNIHDMFILNEIWAQDNICILVGALLGLNMNLVLFYNFNFT